jgi:hypothetical protein
MRSFLGTRGRFEPALCAQENDFHPANVEKPIDTTWEYYNRWNRTIYINNG